MDINSAIKILQESEGNSLYSIYIPSFKKEYNFKRLTTGQQKTISKISIDNDGLNNIEYHIAQLAEIINCCTEKINVNKLTDVDFITIMASIRNNNIINPLKIKFKCPNCKQESPVKKKNEEFDKIPFEFEITVDFDYTIQQGIDFEFKTIDYEKEYNGNKFKFTLNDPYIIDNLSYQNYINTILNDPELLKIIDIKKEKLLNYPIQFIKEIYINDNKINQWEELKFQDKLEFYNKIPGNITFDENDSLFLTTLDSFPFDRLNKLFPNIKCPKCNEQKEGVGTFDSFFTI